MSKERTDHPPVEGGYSGIPRKRTCNLHRDCDEADRVYQDRFNRKAMHCDIEDCEDCFGC